MLSSIFDRIARLRGIRSRTALWAAALLLTSTIVSATTVTVQFNGSVTLIEEPSIVFKVGDSIQTKYTFDTDFDLWNGDYSESVSMYRALAGSLSINSIEHLITGESYYLGEYNYFGQYGPNFGASFITDVTVFAQIGFYSTDHQVTGIDGVLLPGFSIGDFDYAFGRLTDKQQGSAFWTIDSYQVVPSRVPDSSSVVWLLGLSLMSLGVVRRRLRAV
jgi:hypothetical protein